VSRKRLLTRAALFLPKLSLTAIKIAPSCTLPGCKSVAYAVPVVSTCGLDHRLIARNPPGSVRWGHEISKLQIRLKPRVKMRGAKNSVVRLTLFKSDRFSFLKNLGRYNRA
jgi:hypothetical protein